MTTPSPSRPAWITCSRGALLHNLGLLAGAVGGPGRVLAVLKAGAYGHGAGEAGLCLARGGVRSFGVATLEEGLALRRAGVRGAILLLGPLEPSLAPRAARAGVTATAWHRPWLDEADARLGRGGRLDVHLKVDTGMARLGVAPGDVPGLLGDFASRRWPRLRLRGAYTHFSCADERPDPATRGQLRAFTSLPWPRGLPLHAANSAAALRYPSARLDLVRSGILLYGALDPGLHPLARLQRPVLGFRAGVLRVAPVRRGAGVGYGRAYVAPRDTLVATVCAGYADGVPRRLGNRGRVLIRGRLRPILGRVCMDLFMADVGAPPHAAPGDPVELLRDTEGPLSPRGWAEAAGTNAYEILCGLGPRLPRRWGDA